MNTPGRERWIQLWQAAGGAGDGLGCYDQLTMLYTEPHRYYHNFHHIAECLREFDSVKESAMQPVAVEMAIWFHDAIYDPHAADNEERSADLARECLLRGEAGNEFAEQVARLVLVTKYHVASMDADAPLVLDVDLSVLGQSVKKFDEYETQIRQEYAWVPEEVFRSKRAEILEKFLNRERIYATEWFWKRYEKKARLNLQNSIRKLRDAVSHSR